MPHTPNYSLGGTVEKNAVMRTNNCIPVNNFNNSFLQIESAVRFGKEFNPNLSSKMMINLSISINETISALYFFHVIHTPT